MEGIIIVSLENLVKDAEKFVLDCDYVGVVLTGKRDKQYETVKNALEKRGISVNNMEDLLAYGMSEEEIKRENYIIKLEQLSIISIPAQAI